jgi:hypothetical protein
MTAPAITLLDLKVGDVVEVLSRAEILATLDENGELDNLPFMPEMLEYCGKRLRVGKVAHKSCDTLTRGGMRKMENAVHLLGVRCGGGAHGGCQAACLIFWKLDWLKKAAPDAPVDTIPVDTTPAVADNEPRLLPLLTIATRRPDGDDGSPRYRCQATELGRATPHQLPVREVAQYVQDVRSGNVSAFWMARATFVGLYNRLQDLSIRKLPPKLRLRGGKRWGDLVGRAVGKTPTRVLGLQPGDIVRVRSREEIEQTLNPELLNRGMGFDAEMARFCGQTARVARRVDHIIDEHSGEMLVMKSPCIVLEGIICEGAFSASCPRSITPYWREIWLEKVESATAPSRDADTAGVR